MNKVCIIGNITQPLELKETTSKMKITKFTVAVKRDKDKTDFISCIAFNKLAETICNYFNKGSKIGIEGRIQTGSYEKNNKKIYTTDIIVENITFLDKKNETTSEEQTPINEDPFSSFNEEIESDFLN